MGSRRTHEGRVERLREAGLDDAEIARVMSPIGLDIGARTPEETAVAICAEIIALRTGRRVASLRDTAARFTDRSTTIPGGARGSRDRRASGRRSRRRRRVSASRSRQALAAEGVHVAICGRRRGRRSTRRPSALGGGAVPIVADVSTAEGATGFVRDARGALGGIDILVANAGGPPAGDFAQHDGRPVPRGVRAQLPVDDRDVLRGGARDARAAVGEGGRDHVDRGAPADPDLILSNTARAGLTGFLKTLAREVAADGVTVNSLLPGLHETERVAALHGGGADDLAAGIPAGVLGEPDDFGRIAAFLCSERARYVTGTAIPVDGGAYAGLL